MKDLYTENKTLSKEIEALAGVAQWTERRAVNQKVPVRAQAWVAGQVPSWECVRGNQLMYLSHINVSLPLFLPPSPSLKVTK